ncbi:Aspartyl aminopeptidase [Hespellia stercorisuis DSM 15480]|uniref:M18 family aminopeptidase n=1 Tax=Hespellia stercorisuis DSM 15480 TaxID=1121950 RepID=A0A1M6KP07_9FIRM|nr:Aspartyl aminopeptidase [Hespellia stercorisuis DSM 15480]
METKNLWEVYSEEQLGELEEVNNGYRRFLDEGKTERESVEATVRLAKEAGYEDLQDVIASGRKLAAGDKVYSTCMDKTVVLFQIGTEPMEKGMRILGAHIDSPRIDLKQNPVYEDTGLAYFDTHYYGGIKKYQWVTLPLAIHGVVAFKDGTKKNIIIGEEESDPVFVVTDLLIHLSQEQMDKKADKVVEGENLDLLIGSKPLVGEEKDAVKANVLKLLKDKYGIEEADFQSAELEIVPAGKARNCGLDNSMIMAYGQDDRICAYTSLAAMLEKKEVKQTACCILVDKEEIGSVGATGMHSRFFENAVAEVMELTGQFSELKLRRAMANSQMISSDVSAAYDPMYSAAYTKRSASEFGKGLVLTKFTGSRGKSGSNDANAEYIAKLRKIFDDSQVTYQMTELGKVDLGGGGTIAYILANFGMEVIDGGVAVLCMHAPWEVASKADVYEAVRGYRVFLETETL